MVAITDDLLELMPDTLVATPGTYDQFGGFTASGTVLNLRCRIEGEARLVRDLKGQEVVSSVQVFVGSVNNLSVNGHAYTLPSRFDPNSNIRAISVEHAPDEDGPHHEVVMLP